MTFLVEETGLAERQNGFVGYHLLIILCTSLLFFFPRAMAPIPLRVTSEPQMSLEYQSPPTSAMPHLPSLEFDRQSSALADLLALTDTAVSPFTHSSPQSQKPPALTPDPLQPYANKFQPSPEWASMPVFGDSPPIPNDTLPFTWSPPLA